MMCLPTLLPNLARLVDAPTTAKREEAKKEAILEEVDIAIVKEDAE